MTTMQQLRNWSFAAVLTVLSPVVALAQGPAEGLKVHGHWVLEVHNPDGTFVERREFDNALVKSTPGTLQGGDTALAALIGGQVRSFSWIVDIAETTGAFGEGIGGPCGTGLNGVCYAYQFSGGVTVNVPVGTYSTGSQLMVPLGTVELTGNVTATVGGTIGSVGTEWSVISTSNAGYSLRFSSHRLEQSLTVAPGQIVQFKVVFSFS